MSTMKVNNLLLRLLLKSYLEESDLVLVKNLRLNNY
jgi:hypothetical protein